MLRCIFQFLIMKKKPNFRAERTGGSVRASFIAGKIQSWLQGFITKGGETRLLRNVHPNKRMLPPSHPHPPVTAPLSPKMLTPPPANDPKNECSAIQGEIPFFNFI